MTYLALARTWRPRNFDDVVGQPHIVRALTNALTSGRVHHAFLFTGTRGVGKTTVARILARCLNCEQGVSATPCGRCKACIAIDEGRFVDLIEVDAASRTGVDDIRELLDNVQYTPASGRFKVYLVDEVHMLSKPAFNALLKTLEEPPPHVKFLFATTDPERLPVTVLSRCLQFNLKRLSSTAVVDRMMRICDAEGIEAEPGALGQLARAGAGSMRDALSLLDQALAFGGGRLRDQDVAEMLGTMDRGRVLALLETIAAGDAQRVLGALRELDEFVPDYHSLLAEMALNLQQAAVIQLAGPDAVDDPDSLPALQRLAAALDPDTIQLYYEIAVRGRRDLDLAPDPRMGFEMLLLRMLVFRQQESSATTPQGTTHQSSPAQVPRQVAGSDPVDVKSADDWVSLAGVLGLEGGARQLAMHCSLLARTGNSLRLGVLKADAHLLTDQLKSRVMAAIQRHLGDDLRVSMEIIEAPVGVSAAGRDAERQSDELQRARSAIESDQNVRDLAAVFGAQVLPDSIKPAKASQSRQGRGSKKESGSTEHEG